MTSQLDLARAITEGRVHASQDPALQRSAELAREDARALRRTERRRRRHR